MHEGTMHPHTIKNNKHIHCVISGIAALQTAVQERAPEVSELPSVDVALPV
jgi:hypothetical protein